MTASTPATSALGTHAHGILLATFGVLIFTPDTLVFRLLDTDSITILFWRSLMTGATLLAVYWLISDRTQFRRDLRLDRNGWISVFGLTMAEIGFVTAVLNAPAADALVVLASVPVFAALIAFILFRERQPVYTLVAIAVCMAGIAITVNGTSATSGIFGPTMALMSAVGWALHLNFLRQSPSSSPYVVVAFASLIAALVAFVISRPAPMELGSWGLLFLLGIVVHPLSFLSIAKASKLIASAEVSLISLLETLLGPFWVWLVIGEEPTTNTLIGGTIVLVTLIVHAVIALGAERARERPA